MKHLKVPVKWNWWWNFACVSTKSLNFEIYFLSFLWEIIFRCYMYFRQLFMYLALKKCKNDCRIFEITLVQILSTDTWNCSIFYRLNTVKSSLLTVCNLKLPMHCVIHTISSSFEILGFDFVVHIYLLYREVSLLTFFQSWESRQRLKKSWM